ncbi:interference hedgehog-like [Littorina saxatilis]|uniref:interference hedgehog-like n=1 Tax=Littorina saxatilis TaxID=31220 RepID=UPI0038B49F37
MHKATVESLTVNDTNEPVTVKADDLVTLYVICKSTGRPKPNVTVAKGKDILNFTDKQYQRTGNLSHEAVVTMTEVQCRDMGTYTCTADNGVGDPDTRSIRLNVKCKPRSVSPVSWDLTKTHLDFRLEAHPVPTTFVFIHFGNLSTDSGHVVPSEMFSAKCKQDPVTEFIVNCRVTPLNVPKRLLGLYRAHVHNSLGSSEFTFTLQEYKRELLR